LKKAHQPPHKPNFTQWNWQQEKAGAANVGFPGSRQDYINEDTAPPPVALIDYHTQKPDQSPLVWLLCVVIGSVNVKS